MTDQPRYLLKVDLSIEKQENAGGPANPDGTAVDPTNPPYWASRNNERLSVREELNLGGMDFMGVMKVLGEMHDAINTISPNVKESHADKDQNHSSSDSEVEFRRIRGRS